MSPVGDSWLIRTRRGIQGPFSEERVLRYAREGRLRPDLELSPDGRQWRSAREWGFFPEGPQRPAEEHDVTAVDPGDSDPRLHAAADLRRIDRYRVVRRLGEGGMGVVYVVEDETLERCMALKLIRPRDLFGLDQPDPAQLARFEEEIRQCARLNDPGHPGIVPIYQAGRHEGQPFFTMELVRGQPMGEVIGTEGMAPEAAARVVAALAEAVHYAHTHPAGGLVHRDIKPDNVMLDEGGNPHLLDFGLARELEGRREQIETAGIAGTPAYMAPEQASGGAVGPAADIYALGAVLYHALAGRPPFEGDSPAELLFQVAHARPIPPHRIRDGVPPHLSAICLKAMDREPARRYRSALELGHDLVRWLRGWQTTAGQRTWVDSAGDWMLAHRGAVALIAGLVLLATVSAIWIQRRLLAEQLAFDKRLETFADPVLRRVETHPADPALAWQLARLTRHRPDRTEWTEAARRAATARSKARVARAVKLLQQAEQQLAAGDLWGASSSLLRAGAHGARPDQVRAIRKQIAVLSGTDLWIGGRRVSAQALKKQGWVAYRGWWYPPDEARRRGIVQVGERTATTADQIADGWVQDGAKWYPSVKAAVQAGLVRLGEALVTPALLRRAGYGQDPGGKWEAVVELKRQGLCWFGGKWQPRVPLAAAGKLVRQEDRFLTPVELGQQGLLQDGERWIEWERLVQAGRARLVTDERSPGRAFVFWRGELGGGSVEWVGELGRRGLFQYQGEVLSREEVGRRGLLLYNGEVLSREEVGRRGLLLYEGKPLSRDELARRDLVFHAGQILTRRAFSQRWIRAAQEQTAVWTGHKWWISSVAFSPDGTLLASAGADQTIRFWHVKGRRTLATRRGSEAAVYSVAFSPNGALLASGSGDSTIRIWDVRSHRVLATLKGHASQVYSVAFSPDGALLASGSADSTIRIWDVKSRREIATLKGHEQDVISVVFSPDGALLASASWDRTIRIWQVKTHDELVTLTGHLSHVRSVAFSPDGAQLASASDDKTIRIWDVASHREIATLTGHQAAVYSVAFCPNGVLLASASADKTIRIWDVKSRRELATLKGHTQAVTDIAFSPDGTLLASGCWDNTVRIWGAR